MLESQHTQAAGPTRRSARATALAVLAFALTVGCAPEQPVAPADEAEVELEQDATTADGELPISLTREEGIPPGGVELGYGWDSRRGEIVPSRCVEFAPVRATGQVATMNLREVSDQSEVMDSLRVSASVSVKTMFSSGSAQASFARDTKVSSTATSLMLQATVDNGVLFAGPKAPPFPDRPAFGERSADQSGTGPFIDRDAATSNHLTLQPWADRLVSDPQRFRKHCGDSFVSSISSGAQLIAMIEFATSSKQDKLTKKAAVEAAFGPAELSAKAQEDSSAKLENTSLEIQFLQVGGGSGVLPTDKDTLLQKVHELPIEAARDPKFHSMRVTPYESLPGWTGGSLSRDRDEDEIVADYYWFLTSLYSDIEEILEAPRNDYVQGIGLSGAELRGFQDGVLELRSTLFEVMRAKRDGEIPSPAPTTEDLRVLAEIEAHPAALPGPGSAPTLEAWHRHFNELLRRSIPFGNPNVLKLRLPIPAAQSPVVEIVGPSDYARAAVDWYVRPQALRMCELDPTDNECLSNAEMDQLVELMVARSDGANEDAG